MKRLQDWIGRVLCLSALVCIMAGCTDDSKSKRILEEQGYTDIELTGYSPFSCSEDDTFSTGFKAKSPSGQRVTGTVCCGLLKNCTIRLD